MAQADFDGEPLLRGRPILMRRVDGHAIWVSSRVIREAGELPGSVQGGEIIRDENGKPTGTNLETLYPAFLIMLRLRTDRYFCGQCHVSDRTSSLDRQANVGLLRLRGEGGTVLRLNINP